MSCVSLATLLLCRVSGTANILGNSIVNCCDEHSEFESELSPVGHSLCKVLNHRGVTQILNPVAPRTLVAALHTVKGQR